MGRVNGGNVIGSWKHVTPICCREDIYLLPLVNICYIVLQLINLLQSSVSVRKTMITHHSSEPNLLSFYYLENTSILDNDIIFLTAIYVPHHSNIAYPIPF